MGGLINEAKYLTGLETTYVKDSNVYLLMATDF